MNLIPLSFILSGLLALPVMAAGSSTEADFAAPALVHLDQQLTTTLQDKAQGRLSPGHYTEFVAKFRIDLAAAKAGAPPSAANASLYMKILARLGEGDPAAVNRGVAVATSDSRSNLSRAHFEGQTTPAVLAAEKAALKSEPFSNGRGGPGDVVAAEGPQRKIRFAQVDPDTLPIEPTIKISPAAAPPGLTGTPTPKDPSPLPLVPLTFAVGLGAAAYGVSQSKAAYVSKDGLDDAHPVQPGPYQRLVANTILAGAAGGVIYLAGAAALTTVVPAALRYAAPVLEQGVRLAGSEAGAINPESAQEIEEIAPQGEAASVEAEQIVIKKGEILNRVWHSDWTPGSAHSGPEGFSYCRGACLPIHASHAIEARGLNVGVINNARQGGLYRATEDIVVTIRQAIGGYDEEVLLRSPGDIKKLEPISESISTIPHHP